jgi:hypothetical protein
VGVFVRRVKTASGATAVQIVHKRGRTVLSIEHVGSAHTDDELALLLQVAQERRHGGQLALDLEDAGGPGAGASAVVEGTASLILWEALAGIYADLGLERLGDDAFRALVLARVIEPTSKADTVRVLGEIGVVSPHRVTFMRCLKRMIERDYRAVVAQACHRHATQDGGLAVVLYDVTTLHFEVEREDTLRKVGMSKEHRVDPQVTVGLLTTAGGFPLEVDLFEGNKAETKTLIPVLTRFRDRYQARDIIVVADAGMLSAANLMSLEDNGFRFIVGSKTGKIPYELEAHVERKGNYLPDGATIENHPPDGHRHEGPRSAGGLPLRVQAGPARQPGDQRDGRTRREGRRRRAAAEEGPLRHLHRHHHQRELEPRRTRPLPGRDQGFRDQHRPRRDGRPRDRRRLPRPLPGRTLLSDDQE